MRRQSRQGATLGVLVVTALSACVASPSPIGSEEPSASPTAPATASPSAAPTQVPTAWRELPASGATPAAREDHTWTVDSEGRFAYLFGGRDDTGPGAFGDLWAYDLAADTWRPLSGGPPARFGHNAAWVPNIGLVIFAGQSDSGFFDDLWAYDAVGDSWQQLPGNGDRPVARYGSCAALGPDGRLWISHGFTSEGSRFADTRAYDFATAAWSDETPTGDVPVVRCLHACWWTDAGRFVLFAGQTTGVTALRDLWELTVGPRPGTSSWTEIGADHPAVNLYGATRWPSGVIEGSGSTVLFGGQSSDGSYVNHVWFHDDGTPALGTWALASTSVPAPRAGVEIIADVARDRFLVFGGKDDTRVFGDLWELTLVTQTLEAP